MFNASFPRLRTLTATALLLVLWAGAALAQNAEEIINAEGYLSPPEEIAAIALAPWSDNVTLSNRSPDGRWFLRTLSDGLPSVALFARPFYRLGGQQIDPVANRNRRYTTRNNPGFELIGWPDLNRVRIDAPDGARVSNPSFSPDGTKLAYYVHTDEATHIWVYEIDSGRARAVTRTPTLTTLASSFTWTADSAHIVCVLVPEDRADAPPEPPVPTTPMIRVTEEGENKLRIYASLLETPHDMTLLEYYSTGQLALIDVARRRAAPIGAPDMIRSFNISPDGQYLRVTRMTKPFSYIVPVSNFGSVEEIWDLEGNVLTEISSRELRTGISDGGGGGFARGGDQQGKRSLSWRPDGAGLSYLEQEPRQRGEEGDEEPQEESEQEEEHPRKDRVMLWVAPFDSTSTEIVFESETRMRSVLYSADCQTLYITEREGSTETLYAVNLDDPETRFTIYERDTDDYYDTRGGLQMKPGPLGAAVVRTSSDGSCAYLAGTQSFENWQEQAPRPFFHRVEIATGEIDTLWTGGEDSSDRILEQLDDDATQLIISRESPTMISDSWLVETATGTVRKLTDNVDYAPQVTGAQRQRFQVTRADGITFWVDVTLPPGYVAGTRLPAMFWFYPREYTSQKDLDESMRRTNINSFPRVSTRSMEILTILGYAVIEPACPIMGSEGALNDTYTADLRQNLYAVIRALDEKAIIDPDRLAIGGHSYGAFGTANALIQTPFFRAGIAGDGNYNRLLTPAGFQSERRELWEMREVYLRMSPILWANELNGALLMYHGQHDQNTGTAPFHAPKMFHALNDLGKTAALYMYPYEDHGPATVETTLDLWARWVAWLDRYVLHYEDYEKEDEGEGEGRRGRRGRVPPGF